MEHPWCDLIYLTDIMAEFECDVFFPEFDKKLFEVQDRYVQSSLNEEHKSEEERKPPLSSSDYRGILQLWIFSHVSESRKGTCGKNVSNQWSHLMIFSDHRQLCFCISEIAMETETTCRHSINFTNISLALKAIWNCRFLSQHDRYEDDCVSSGLSGIGFFEHCSTSLKPTRSLFCCSQSSFPDVPNGIQEDNGIKYKCQVYKRKTAGKDQQWSSSELFKTMWPKVCHWFILKLLTVWSNLFHW